MTPVEAESVALSFLLTDLEIPEDDREWFAVLGSKSVQDSWYVVELGVEGLPDKWVLQVYDTGECDPNYTFSSPIKAAAGTSDLDEMPEAIKGAIATERNNMAVAS
jgi:hypothetical protein